MKLWLTTLFAVPFSEVRTLKTHAACMLSKHCRLNAHVSCAQGQPDHPAMHGGRAVDQLHYAAAGAPPAP